MLIKLESRFLAEFADLPGCNSDSGTPGEAMANGHDALEARPLSCIKDGGSMPSSGVVRRSEAASTRSVQF